MSTMGPGVLLVAVIVVFCLVLFYAAIESFRYELMARSRLLMLIVVLIVVFALVAFYFAYVLGGPASPALFPESDL